LNAYALRGPTTDDVAGQHLVRIHGLGNGAGVAEAGKPSGDAESFVVLSSAVGRGGWDLKTN
jgi:hypothetical protein